MSDNGSKALFYCSLLALQFGLQPIISNKFIDVGVSKSSVVIATELFKICIAAVSFATESKDERTRVISSWSLTDSVYVAALPATLYAIQNLLVQNGYMYLDSMTFCLLNQTKTISAAFWLYFIMGKPQSVIQMFALLLLLIAAVVLNMEGNPFSDVNGSDPTPSDDHVYKTFGIFLVSGASLLSGLSSALTQKAVVPVEVKDNIKEKPRHTMLLSAEMAVYGIIFLLVNLWFNSDIAEGGDMMSHWTVWTLIPVLTNSFGGIVVGMVTKYAGGVVKGFALIAGIIITGVARWIIENKSLQQKDLIGILLVSVSIYLHTSFPPSSGAKPTVTITPATTAKSKKTQ